MRLFIIGLVEIIVMLHPRSPCAETNVILEETIVTAERLEENAQDVPITVNVFDDRFLRTIGAQTLKDLEVYAPALEVSNETVTQPNFTIRGIGTADFGIGTDPAVAVYSDGVYTGRSGTALLQFMDAERVEVLSGPQGTLFGRNSAAGAIQIVNKKPNNRLEAFLRTRLGNYDKRLVEAMANTPLIPDRLSLRVNAIYNRRDGYIDNAAGGPNYSDEEYDAARASLLWKITPQTGARYIFEYNSVDQQGPVAIGLNEQLSPTGGQVFGKVANDVIDGDESRDLQAHTLLLEQFWSENLKFASVSSYRSFTTASRQDEDGVDETYAYFDTLNEESSSQFYQELRLNGDHGKVRWVGGFNYYLERSAQNTLATTTTDSLNAIAQNSLPVPPIPNYPLPDGRLWNEAVQNRADTDSYAFFGDMTWEMIDHLDVTAGLRYTHDDKCFSWLVLPNQLLGKEFDQIFAGPAYPAEMKNHWITSEKSWSNLSPRAAVVYHWSADAMSYLSYSRGYKSGGFGSVQVLSEFEPEFIDNYEAGIKSEWFGKRLKANAAFFYNRYDNKQDVVFEQQGALGAFVTRTGNAEGLGLNLELAWLPLDHLRFGINYGYLDAHWTDRTVNAIDYQTGTSSLINLSGQPLAALNHQLAATLDFEQPLVEYGSLLLHLDHRYASPQHFNAADAESYFDYDGRDADYNLTNARLSWRDPSKHWEIALWAENLFDYDYATRINPITALALGTPYVRREKPRFWGVEFIVTF
jgi:iron complex outermembrane receptor protein